MVSRFILKLLFCFICLVSVTFFITCFIMVLVFALPVFVIGCSAVIAFTCVLLPYHLVCVIHHVMQLSVTLFSLVWLCRDKDLKCNVTYFCWCNYKIEHLLAYNLEAKKTVYQILIPQQGPIVISLLLIFVQHELVLFSWLLLGHFLISSVFPPKTYGAGVADRLMLWFDIAFL